MTAREPKITVRCPRCGSERAPCGVRRNGRYYPARRTHEVRSALVRLRMAELDAWLCLSTKDRKILRKLGIGATT